MVGRMAAIVTLYAASVLVITALGDELMPNRRKAIIWTNYDLNQCWIIVNYTSRTKLGDMITTTLFIKKYMRKQRLQNVSHVV